MFNEDYINFIFLHQLYYAREYFNKETKFDNYWWVNELFFVEILESKFSKIERNLFEYIVNEFLKKEILLVKDKISVFIKNKYYCIFNQSYSPNISFSPIELCKGFNNKDNYSEKDIIKLENTLQKLSRIQVKMTYKRNGRKSIYDDECIDDNVVTTSFMIRFIKYYDGLLEEELDLIDKGIPDYEKLKYIIIFFPK